MNNKTKNSIILLVILLIVIIGGSLYSFVYQSGKIEEREKKVNELNLYAMDTNELLAQLDMLKARVVELDSILSMRKYNIPYDLPQTRFFDFVNKISFSFASRSHVNIEYDKFTPGQNYSYYTYRLSGTAYFNDFYKLIYAIEQSKFLKKIETINVTNFVTVEEDGTPFYLVNFRMVVAVYFSDTDRFTTSNLKENRLRANPLYDIFYPLIRNEIPPNTEKLLDVQTASLLALIPDGAFLSDDKGNTFLLWEGDEVYLGYLTKINYEMNEVRFILNKGGIIENVALKLEKEKTSE